ncbi:MAG: radical SAM protein [Bacteroidales bacterium]|jgi:putative pyruvate formate lyase activating enzyme
MIELLGSCKLCPHKCGIDRYKQTGFCNCSEKILINTYHLHRWEEPIISGNNGSGTIFFSGCNLQCVFCQNFKISHYRYGELYDIAELSNIMLELQNKKAHNINLVTPTHFSLQIKEAIITAKNKGLEIPVIWNSNGYEEVETLEMLDGLIDIYLPDFKYFDSELSLKYSGAADYPIKAKDAIKEMFRQVGNIKLKNNIALKGLLIRLLVLPENINGIENIMKWIFENIGNEVFISLMGQYYPTHKAKLFPEINRSITNKEYQFAIEQMEKYGFENGFMQEVGSSANYTPDFEES